jgi:hypothetical protein
VVLVVLVLGVVVLVVFVLVVFEFGDDRAGSVEEAATSATISVEGAVAAEPAAQAAVITVIKAIAAIDTRCCLLDDVLDDELDGLVDGLPTGSGRFLDIAMWCATREELLLHPALFVPAEKRHFDLGLCD